jgi:predicted enzyme related to lactoylglutathione lyase
MPNIEKHAPGSFCWIELATTDQNAAKAFYAGLFGWGSVDFPMGPDASYTMFNIDGRNAAAAYALKPEMQSQGIPPHWMVYVAVESADATADKVTAAGGKVTVAPFDVYDFGRMAVLQDPTGAMFSVWQAMKHTGTGIGKVPGTLCWADLDSPDQAAAAAFYAAVFGWQMMPGQDNSGYLHIKNGEEFIGGIRPPQHQDPNVPPHWISFFMTADCDATTAKARELGARVYMEPMTIGDAGRMAVLADPQGAAFSVIQPLQR